MTIDFNDMSDDRYTERDAILLLLIGNTAHEAIYELGRNQFYLYNNMHWNDMGEYEELPDYIDEDDERIKGWAPSRLREDA